MRAKLVLAVAAALLVAADKDVTKKTDQDKIQGTWVIASAVEGGREAAEIKGNKVIVSGNTLTHKIGNEDKKATFKLNPDKKPKEIDLVDQERNKTMPGIYTLEGDTLKICIAEKRPTDFKAEGAMTILLVLKREKK